MTDPDAGPPYGKPPSTGDAALDLLRDARDRDARFLDQSIEQIDSLTAQLTDVQQDRQKARDRITQVEKTIDLLVAFSPPTKPRPVIVNAVSRWLDTDRDGNATSGNASRRLPHNGGMWRRPDGHLMSYQADDDGYVRLPAVTLDVLLEEAGYSWSPDA